MMLAIQEMKSYFLTKDSFDLNDKEYNAIIENTSHSSLYDLFTHMKNSKKYSDNFRYFSAHLLKRKIISLEEYVDGKATYYLSMKNGQFLDLKTLESADFIADRYSLAKNGSIEDIHFFAKIIAQEINKEIDDTNSSWFKMFEDAKLHDDTVVLMTPGLRNVPSSANIMFEIALTYINVKLATMGYPTIVNVKLPRIAAPCENYGSLSTEERKQISIIQDHVIPDKNFYKWSGVHVIFGDDILVTGLTADKVFFESMQNGAKSFRSFYPVVIDPVVAFENPSIEEKLNLVKFTGKLDDIAFYIFSNPNYIPILRSLRFIFNEQNYSSMPEFLKRIPNSNLLKIYLAALSNGFMLHEKYKNSLELVKHHLIASNNLDKNGFIII